MTNMKILVVAKPRKMVWQQSMKPTAAAYEVLIKPIVASICGTDIHAWAGNQPFFSYSAACWAMNCMAKWWRPVVRRIIVRLR